jgi:N-methylhydantoinase B
VVRAGAVIALAATCLHHQDVGGMTAGSIPPNAVEIYQEGLRLPPLRWRTAAGVDDNVAVILEANSRTPVNLRGDLSAQWSAVSLGARELEALAVRVGEVFMPACEALIAQAEQMTRAALRAAPDGEWSWEDQLDGSADANGVEGAPVRIAVRLRKQGDAIDIDFTGSSPQVQGPINASPASVMSAALFFMRTLAPEAPNNAGCLAPLTLHLPPGSILNPDLPAAVNARTATVKLACNAMLGAWSQAGAGVSVAPHAGVATVMSMSGTRSNGTRWMLTEIVASGAGASALGPGRSGVSTDIGNARNTPLEVIESEAPLLLECYAIRHGSGGVGQHEGGHGVRRVYRLLDGQAVLSYRGERHASRARGAQGGAAGAASKAWMERADGHIEPLGARARVEWRPGDRLVIETAGGGGWGSAPAATAPSSISSSSSSENQGTPR